MSENKSTDEFKEVFKYVDNNKEYLFIFSVDGEKVIVKRYKLTLDEEKIFE